jgi:hypothetical protein
MDLWVPCYGLSYPSFKAVNSQSGFAHICEDIIESLGHQLLKAEAMLAQTCMASDISGEK